MALQTTMFKKERAVVLNGWQESMSDTAHRNTMIDSNLKSKFYSKRQIHVKDTKP